MLYRSLVFICLLATTSCLDNKDYAFDSITLTPTVALPLAYGEIGILDLIGDKDSSYLKVYPDGLLYFAYPPKTFESPDLRNLFKLPDNTTSSSFSLPASILPPIPKDVRTDSIIQVIDLGLSPEQLSEVGFKTGTVNYAIGISPASLNLAFEVNLILTDIVDKTTQVPLNFTAGPGTGSKSIVNYVGKMTKNKFNVKMVLVLKKRATPVVVPINSKVNIQLTFKGMDFNYILGFFGDKTTTLEPETFDLGVFSSSLKNSKVSLVQPVVTLSVSSDYGVPSLLTFTSLEARKGSASLPFVINPASPLSLNYPSVIGNSATTAITVVNASDLLNFSPTQLGYSASIRINKGQTSGSNFLADASKLRITMSAEVPLYGKVSGISVYDTLKMDFGDLKEASINDASLKVKSVNEMPLDANIQLYLTDKNYHILDSLFASNQTYIIKASSVTGPGDLDKAGSANVDLNLSDEKINKLFSANYLIIRARLNTSRDANGALLNVKFKSSYKLKMNIGLSAKLNITVKK